MSMRKILLPGAVLLFVLQGMAQVRTVSGRITDEKGDAVPKVSVVVKGTKVGTATDTAGFYTITIPPRARSLYFSSVNMEPKEVAIGSQNNISISLSISEQTLEEVMVVAYGTQKKSNLTGAQ